MSICLFTGKNINGYSELHTHPHHKFKHGSTSISIHPSIVFIHFSFVCWKMDNLRSGKCHSLEGIPPRKQRFCICCSWGSEVCFNSGLHWVSKVSRMRQAGARHFKRPRTTIALTIRLGQGLFSELEALKKWVQIRICTWSWVKSTWFGIGFGMWGVQGQIYICI